MIENKRKMIQDLELKQNPIKKQTELTAKISQQIKEEKAQLQLLQISLKKETDTEKIKELNHNLETRKNSLNQANIN